MKTENISTDILIIGGGTAGCYAARQPLLLICAFSHIRTFLSEFAAIVMAA